MNNKKTFIFVGLIAFVVCVVASMLASVTYEGSSVSNTHNSRSLTNRRYSTESLNTEYKNYTAHSTDDGIEVTAHDKITGTNHTYNIGVGNAPRIPEPSAQQKRYLAQNKELVLLASKVYGFIAFNDYRLVKFCANYYPVNKFKTKYNNQFRDKKIKAENILEKAYGVEGSAALKTAMLSNSDALRVVYQQVEDDYQLVRGMAAKDGITNFSRKDYCKMFEDSPDEAVEQEYRKFKLMAPSF